MISFSLPFALCFATCSPTFLWADIKPAHETNTCISGHYPSVTSVSSFANVNLDRGVGAEGQGAFIKSPRTWASGVQDFHPDTATFFQELLSIIFYYSIFNEIFSAADTIQNTQLKVAFIIRTFQIQLKKCSKVEGPRVGAAAQCCSRSP